MINFKKYKRAFNELNDSANSLWNKVSFTTPAEILEGEVDLGAFDKICWSLKDTSSNFRQALSKEMDAIPEDEYFDKYEQEHNETDDLFYRVDDKLDIIDSVISNLREIEDKFEESEARGKFQDITRIHLDESIRLRRFS